MIVALLLLLATASPLSQASDYRFIPTIPSLIKGTVSEGSTSGAIRAEDVFFVNEAISERTYALRSFTDARSFTNSINYELSTTNYFAANSAVIKKYPFLEFDVILNKYVSPSNSLETTALVLQYKENDREIVGLSTPSNVVTRRRWTDPQLDWSRYYQVTNLVMQTMTNGTVDVYTNIYPQGTMRFAPLKLVEETYTNVLRICDHCYASPYLTWPESLPSNIWASIVGNVRTPSPWHSRQMLDDAYEFVRAARMSAPISTGYIDTNIWTTTTRWKINSWGSTTCTTNTSTGMESGYVLASVYNDFLRWSDSVNIEESIFSIVNQLPELTTDILEAQDTFGINQSWNSNGRITGAWGFMYVLQYRRGDMSGVSDPTQVERLWIPLGRLTKVPGSNPLRFTINKSVNELLSEIYAISNIEPETYKNFGSQDSYYASWGVNVSGFYIVLEITPNTTLSSWSEYFQ